jgi:DNA mismatch endonuclease (patch repair protein)
MSKQRTRDTAPEIALRRALHRLGYRYRVDVPLPGIPRRRADIVFTARRIAVFVDGCFWHGCPEHATWPANNAAWWASKLKANIERDRDTTARLVANGWTVVRIWEHERLDEALATVLRHLPPRVIETVDAVADGMASTSHRRIAQASLAVPDRGAEAVR